MPSLSQKAVAALSPAALERLHTGSLLTRLQALRALEACPATSAWSPAEIQALRPCMLFQSDPGFLEALAAVKAARAKREHLPRGSKAQRQQQARSSKCAQRTLRARGATA